MKGNELVWRSLADRALEGERTWSNVGDLAYDAGVPTTTAYLALERLEANGTVDRYRPGGFSVVSIEKLLTMLCAWRNLDRDTITRTTRESIEPFLNSARGPYALGGPDAANALLGGHAVSSFREHIVYLPGAGEVDAELTQLRPEPEGDVRVLTMDKRAMKIWDGYSSLAQTYADLFATPGWQASEFRNALRESFVRAREWDQGGDLR
jgi:hypothetical protein